MRLMDSMPPATATSQSPCAMACAADATACRLDAHAMLIV